MLPPAIPKSKLKFMRALHLPRIFLLSGTVHIVQRTTTASLVGLDSKNGSAGYRDAAGPECELARPPRVGLSSRLPELARDKGHRVPHRAVPDLRARAPASPRAQVIHLLSRTAYHLQSSPRRVAMRSEHTARSTNQFWPSIRISPTPHSCVQAGVCGPGRQTPS